LSSKTNTAKPDVKKIAVRPVAHISIAPKSTILIGLVGVRMSAPISEYSENGALNGVTEKQFLF
jgi:hypothetical protein